MPDEGKNVRKNTPNAPGFFWAKSSAEGEFYPVQVLEVGGELVVGRIGYQSMLPISHFPESFWGMELTPPAM